MRNVGAGAIESIIADGEYYGMQTFDQSLLGLYEKGLIYRAKRMINWDPISETVVSDLEVDTVEAMHEFDPSSQRSAAAKSPRCSAAWANNN